MKDSSWSEWQTFLGFCVFSISITGFIGWQIAAVPARHPEHSPIVTSVDRVSTVEQHVTQADTKPQPARNATISERKAESAPLRQPRQPIDAVKESLLVATIAAPVVAPTESPVASSDLPLPVTVERVDQHKEASTALGKKLFLHEWQPHDKLAGSGDGLGPVFNGRSCAECHSQGGLGGAGSNEHSVHAFEIMPSKEGDEVRSGVIHSFATAARDKEDSQILDLHFRPGKVVVGLAQSGKKELTSKRDIDATRLVWINSPALWGLGQIDQLSSDQLKQATNFAVQPANRRTSEQGRFRVHTDGRIGKFGWKGQFASLQDFVAEACASEIGLSNEYARQYLPGEFRPDSKAQPDLSENQIASLVKFVAELPAPRQVMPDDATHRAYVTKGENHFISIGCTNCHIRDVGNVKNVYGDYRLHQVEQTLDKSDAYYVQNFKLEIQPPAYYPQLDEWKTAALWGVADTAPYWHDGSVKTLEGAILRHAREAQPVIDSYRRLARDDQQSVVAFLKTLRGPEQKKSSDSTVVLSTSK